MFYLGIDVGKCNHMVTMLDDSRKAVFRTFTFSNSTEGGKILAAQIAKHAPNAAQVSIGLKATSH